MDTEKPTRRRRGRPRKKVVKTEPKVAHKKQELSEQHVMILLKNHLKDIQGVNRLGLCKKDTPKQIYLSNSC